VSLRGVPGRSFFFGMLFPVIDRAGRFQNLFLATGHGMLGVTTAPATGKLVAELICGQTPHIDPSPFSVGRFG